MAERALVLLGGAIKIPMRQENDIVICADSGFVAAVDNGVSVDYLVGDMDSLPTTYFKIAQGMEVNIHYHEREKDLSDGEIALNLALALGCRKIFITGGMGGRCDHIVSTLFLPFVSDRFIDVEIWLGEDRIHLLKKGDRKVFSGDWRVVSIIPLLEGCTVSTEGLKWALRSDRIETGFTRGIHNEPIADSFSIECEKGSLFVILSNQS